MSAPMLSTSWYRVAALRPRLRSHAELYRHRYRGTVWYLLRDPVNNRVHRFTAGARLLIAAMDGRRSVDALWALTQRRLGDDAPTQDEAIQLLGQLHAADLLQSDVVPDSVEDVERARRTERQRARLNPMALRIPLWDPQRFLDRIAPWTRVLWGRAGALLWLAVVIPALLLVPPHWEELTNNFSDRVLAADNLVLLWLVFPLIKLAHEMGHAVATHRGGGEVHDLGVVLLVMIPVPYVEASAANVFVSKVERAMVAAAGMAVEVFIAALAFYAWLGVEPGLARALLFNVTLVAGVSTLIFNGNPLLRYDAYYLLADLIEIPNLASRSLRWWQWWVERHAFGVRDATPPEGGRREHAWLACYGVASTAYRVLVTVSVSLFIAGQFFVVGVVLALWAVVTMAVWPVVKAVRHLVSSPTLRPRRGRVAGVVGATVVAAVLLLFVCPAPSRQLAEGVVWLPEQAQVRAGHEGFVVRIVAAPGSRVRAGDALVQSRDPKLDAQIRLSEARVAELSASHAAQAFGDRAAAGVVDAQLDAERRSLAVQRERADGLLSRAATAGVFVVPRPGDLDGRYLKTGDLVGYLLPDPDDPAYAARELIVRVAVMQDAADRVRGDTRAVEARLARRPAERWTGHLVREVPGGDEYLPSRALAIEGGGQLATDGRDGHGARTLERTFQFDVALDGKELLPTWGDHVHLRFEHTPRPLGLQAADALRRLFLSHLQL